MTTSTDSSSRLNRAAQDAPPATPPRHTANDDDATASAVLSRRSGFRLVLVIHMNSQEDGCRYRTTPTGNKPGGGKNRRYDCAPESLLSAWPPAELLFLGSRLRVAETADEPISALSPPVDPIHIQPPASSCLTAPAGWHGNPCPPWPGTSAALAGCRRPKR